MAIDRGERIDLVTSEELQPACWKFLSSSDSEVGRELERQAIEYGHPLEVVTYRSASQIGTATTLTSEQDATAPSSDGTNASEVLLSASDKILRGQIDVLVDLKRGPFGRRRGNAALRRYTAALAICATILVVATSAALLYRGHSASHEADQAIARQADVFQQVFPNSKVPVGVLTRLRSELSKLQGLRGDDGSLPSRVSSLVVLERLLKSVPADKRFRLLEVRIEEGRLYLDGETRVHSDAEAIAQQLRAEGFKVSPPKSQRLDDKRVSLRIVGTIELVDRLAKRRSP
jgi:type II secretion system protein L